MAERSEVGREIGREIVVEGIKIRLRPGLVIVGEPENGEYRYGPGVRREKDGTIIQEGHTWKNWASAPIQYSAEASTLNSRARSISRAITPLHEIALFSAPSKRFG